jgi:ABC-2 type transport system ATP-binding protein
MGEDADIIPHGVMPGWRRKDGLRMAEVAIRTEELSRDFETVRAVDHVSLQVPAGTVFGFLGPNGAGKTTTIRLLLGLLEPTGGRAEVLGHDTLREADRIRERTGALLENHGLYERLSAEDNLAFYGRIWRMGVAERGERMRELLTHLGLWERRGELVATWSRGMKQKLAVARTLLHRPVLVFMDEPTAGLDPVAANMLREDMASLAQREGVTVFLTTHNLDEAERLCGLVGVIRAGQLVAVGSPDELRTRGGAPQVTITGRGFGDALLAAVRARPEVAGAEVRNGRLVVTMAEGADSAPLVRAIVELGAEVEEVRRGRSSLEEVFMTLMQEDEAKA